MSHFCLTIFNGWGLHRGASLATAGMDQASMGDRMVHVPVVGPRPGRRRHRVGTVAGAKEASES
jgi:hypothetical protein